jgi:hypothetical protein
VELTPSKLYKIGFDANPQINVKQFDFKSFMKKDVSGNNIDLSGNLIKLDDIISTIDYNNYTQYQNGKLFNGTHVLEVNPRMGKIDANFYFTSNFAGAIKTSTSMALGYKIKPHESVTAVVDGNGNKIPNTESLLMINPGFVYNISYDPLVCQKIE